MSSVYSDDASHLNGDVCNIHEVETCPSCVSIHPYSAIERGDAFSTSIESKIKDEA